MDHSENIYGEGQVLLINKPLHWTSADVVRKIRNCVKAKVGHAGTLDPLATGLLILCTGKFTKRINSFMAQEKEYSGTFQLGAVTPTYDLESEPVNFKDAASVTMEKLLATAERFTGDIMQVPPPHSAVKKNGKRAYEMARQGRELALDPRQITIREFHITGFESPVVHFRMLCSTGTYIRSLAHDLGAALGCGAYLSSLCRSRIGSFTLEQAMTMEEAEADIRTRLALRTDS